MFSLRMNGAQGIEKSAPKWQNWQLVIILFIYIKGLMRDFCLLIYVNVTKPAIHICYSFVLSSQFVKFGEPMSGLEFYDNECTEDYTIF